ncbi:nucleotide pyrophosphohydrolase [Lactiplantibacillus paraplantarum]|uniref:nucleotide pyrophosphohydrolase n=1 Tax=Lactiplantibacillus paraplantarum TaxID=60520 RepID=UPI000513E8DC|nr:nucleotide pyrophosphohydrolase [Lactiplantibacillus paraplantarum]ALO04344.1 nucleotide pyrophosphohydrolase [Lactiplantibacillus paraplantarum]KGE75824.1 nucleotide pyrophosphohydrolase [Lactiplantibacillus paraplantarum]MCW1909570.1 nucleotide pyrophosphohydrolase [Lactiplantibacillus paraplantarum]RDG13945.1 nucleotide pyrophosphohydrolase [Lactiplantibacillus paraplantarum]
MDYSEIEQALIEFRNKKGWQKYHNLKDLAISLNIEASEVLEIFQWHSTEQQLDAAEKQHLQEELADTLIYIFYLCEKIQVDPLEIVAQKMKVNKSRHWNTEEKA